MPPLTLAMARTQAAIAYIPTVVRELGRGAAPAAARRRRDAWSPACTRWGARCSSPARSTTAAATRWIMQARRSTTQRSSPCSPRELDPANCTFLLLGLNAPFAAFANAPAAESRFAEPRGPCCETFFSTAGGRRLLRPAGRRREEAVRAVRRPKQTLLLGQRPPHAGRLGRSRRDFQAQDPRVPLQFIPTFSSFC